MDFNTINYKLINSDNITIDGNNILYNSNDFYIDTPTLKVSNILDIDNKTYLQLKIPKKNSGVFFINSILSIEAFIQKYVSKNSLFLNSQLLKDINENIYVKVKINATLNNIFDKNKTTLSYNSLKINDDIKCILKVSNFYFDYQKLKYGYSLELYQLMILN